jgi:hypothetical protein
MPLMNEAAPRSIPTLIMTMLSINPNLEMGREEWSIDTVPTNDSVSCIFHERAITRGTLQERLEEAQQYSSTHPIIGTALIKAFTRSCRQVGGGTDGAFPAAVAVTDYVVVPSSYRLSTSPVLASNRTCLRLAVSDETFPRSPEACCLVPSRQLPRPAFQ